jgi:hypothetical protein
MKWAVAPSAPTLLISDTGRVIRMASSRKQQNRWQAFPEKELKPNVTGAGYQAVHYKIEGRRHIAYVHRLVMEAFLGLNPDRKEVNHIDGDKSNNKLSNLEWVTHSENHRHAASAGLSATVALDPDAVRAIKAKLHLGSTMVQIAKDHGVSVSAISHIKHGRSWAWLSS